MATIMKTIDLSEELVKFHEMNMDKKLEWMEFYYQIYLAMNMAIDFSKYHNYSEEEKLRLCVLMLCRQKDKNLADEHNEREKNSEQ